MQQNRRRTGAKYEEEAAALLEEQGYCILERNYRCRYGEIDIIAKQEDVLVFVEVKYRSSACYGDPLEAVGRQKQRRISRCALCYCTEHVAAEGVPCRFDVIALYGNREIRHIQDAFAYQQ